MTGRMASLRAIAAAALALPCASVMAGQLATVFLVDAAVSIDHPLVIWQSLNAQERAHYWPRLTAEQRLYHWRTMSRDERREMRRHFTPNDERRFRQRYVLDVRSFNGMSGHVILRLSESERLVLRHQVNQVQALMRERSGSPVPCVAIGECRSVTPGMRRHAEPGPVIHRIVHRLTLP